MNTNPYGENMNTSDSTPWLPHPRLTPTQSFEGWRKERHVVNGMIRVKANLIYDDFARWASEKIYPVPSMTAFFKNLKSFIHQRKRFKNGWHYQLNKKFPLHQS